MKISELGEFKLIDMVAELIEASRDDSPSWKDLIIGVGDDAAAWKGNESVQLGKMDCLVQGVHFDFSYVSWEDLGWKALAINLSDIAAMGGLPRYALVSLGLPPSTEVKEIKSFYRGMLALAKNTGVVIAGGNMSRSLFVFIDVSVFGNTNGADNNLMLRSSAEVGDKIALTGCIGTAAAGFQMLSKKIKLDPRTTDVLKRAFVRPIPRIKEGRLLIENGVKTAIDISDGLLADLGHICDASRVGAMIELEKIPIHETVKKSFGDKSIKFALSGGEDYELLFTAPEQTIKKVERSAKVPVTIIGEVTATRRTIIIKDKDGRQTKPDKTGWDHFKNN